MTGKSVAAPPSDAELVAYLDGELSPADSVLIGQRMAIDDTLAKRVTLLMDGARPFREAYAPLLAQAPAARLEAMLASTIERQQPSRYGPSLRVWLAAIACGIALMILGALIDRVIVPPPAETLTAEAPADEWRAVVAQYLSLYTRETLSAGSGGAPADLAALGATVGLDLTPADVALPGLTLKRSEIFEYDGKSLAFLAYLDPRDGPVSLCVIAEGGAVAPRRIERRAGMNAVYWSNGRREFMLIGRSDVARLQALAGVAETQMEGRAKPSRGNRG